MSAPESTRRALVPRLLSGSAATLLSASVMVTGGSTAVADETVSTRGFYVGIGAGASRLEPESPVAGVRVGEERDTGFHIGLGYDVTRWLSLELQLADLGAAGLDRVLGDGTLDADFDAIEYRVADVAALFYLLDTRGGVVPGRDGAEAYRRDGLSLYARLGAGAMFNDVERGRVRQDKVESAHLSAGLGLEYGFTSALAARAEYIAYDTDAHYASLGVLWRFGRRVAPAPLPAPVPIPPAPTPRPPDPPPPEPVDPAAAGARFAFDSAALSPESRSTLERFAELVRGGDGDLVIEGHTDSIGPSAYNETLGLRRARAARDYLIGLGVAGERVRVESFGEQQPIADNGSPDGRARNRRIAVRELPDP